MKRLNEYNRNINEILGYDSKEFYLKGDRDVSDFFSRIKEQDIQVIGRMNLSNELRFKSAWKPVELGIYKDEVVFGIPEVVSRDTYFYAYY